MKTEAKEEILQDNRTVGQPVYTHEQAVRSMQAYADQETEKLMEALRTAIANYMTSEGCGCCGDYDSHKEHTDVLGKLLNVPKYSDNSGYDFRTLNP